MAGLNFGGQVTSKGVYFQAFTSLSTGLERIGKLCILTAHHIAHNGAFPDQNYMQREIGHDIVAIYNESQLMLPKFSISLKFLQNLADPIHQAILTVLSQFARGDRYSNIDYVLGVKRPSDPVASWFNQIDQPLYSNRVSQKRKDKVETNAFVIASLLEPYATVFHTSETGKEIRDVEEASQMTGVYEAVAPYRQLYVLQVVRYWVELLSALENRAREGGSQDIPFFGEIFAPFFNDDSYFRTRKTWDTI